MSTRERVQALIQYAESGRSLEAYQEFYAEDYVAQENQEPPRAGRQASIDRMQAAVAGVKELHEFRALRSLVDGDQSVVEWVLDYTDSEGRRIKLEEAAFQTWRDGRIVAERFHYGPPQITQV